MSKIPTAEDFFFDFPGLPVYIESYSPEDFSKILIEFAKLHVKAALEAAANNVEVSIELSNPYDPESEYAEVNKQSILSAYPESNIK